MDMFLKPVRLTKCLTFRATHPSPVSQATFWRARAGLQARECDQESYRKWARDQQIECGIYKKPENLQEPLQTIGIKPEDDQGRVRVPDSGKPTKGRDTGFKIARVELIQNIQSFLTKMDESSDERWTPPTNGNPLAWTGHRARPFSWTHWAAGSHRGRSRTLTCSAPTFRAGAAPCKRWHLGPCSSS